MEQGADKHDALSRFSAGLYLGELGMLVMISKGGANEVAKSLVARLTLWRLDKASSLPCVKWMSGGRASMMLYHASRPVAFILESYGKCS